ncbi:MAG: glycosyltransferase family 2 protein [Verrucomicrobiota bacterium]
MKKNSANITLVVPAALGVSLDVLKSANAQTQPLEILVEEGKNPSANRNRGAARATTSLVGFTNAHTILSNNWVERVEEVFKRYPEIDILGGPQLNYPGDSYFARVNGDALASSFCTGKMSVRYRPGPFNLNADETSLTSANLICRRSVFEKIRFDETIYPGEDPKFVTEARNAGFRLAYAPGVIVFNRRRQNFFALGKQVFNYGWARVRKESLAQLLKHPVFFAPTGIILYLLSLPSVLIFGCFWLFPLWVYLFFAVLAAGKRAVECRRWGYFITLPFLFLWIHISYGMGFLLCFLRGGWQSRKIEI